MQQCQRSQKPSDPLDGDVGVEGQVAHQINVPATKPDDLSYIPDSLW